MNAVLIENWNAVVTPSDTVYFLGDFALGPKHLWRSHREALNGRIIFILGNHDTTVPLKRFESMVVLARDFACETSVYHSPDGLSIGLAHFPTGEPTDSRGFIRRACNEPVDLHFCGHVHDAWQERTVDGIRCINVGCDVWQFQPRTLDEILARVPDGKVKLHGPQ
jgi:calcineurin-like phosphoesterase family protein